MSLVREDSSTIIIDGSGIGHVVIINSDDVDLSGFTVQNSGTAYHITGINLNNVNHCNISGNIVANNEYGLELHNLSYYNTISGNIITENDKWGLHIIDSHYNNVSGNIIGGSLWGSIAIHGFSTHNRIFENNVGDNDNGGISIDGSDYNDIYENNITNNLWGISVQYGAKYNAISRNNIKNNNYSFKLEWNTYANMFYHNNLVGNAFPVSIVGYNYANSWDYGYPSGGNYWSDYNGTDLFSGRDQNETGRNAIGDTEYFINGNNADNYPLMGMFSDFEATSEQHVQTICNSTISDFQFNGTAICFNVIGENDTTGFCRICIPTALMNEKYTVLVNGTEISYNLLPCSNETYSYLYFNYTHSTQEVIIVPKFPSFLILPPFMIATLLAVIVYKRLKYPDRKSITAKYLSNQ